jgi:glycosyltransferase involved in cell wall biosynthesis
MNEALWKPLIRRQVIDLIALIQKLESPVRVRIISVFPWHWYLKHRKQLKECKKEYALKSIDITYCAIPVPFPIPYLFPRYVTNVGIRPREGSSSFVQRFNRIFTFPVLWVCHRLYGISIFHGRGYPATDSLLYFKKKFSCVKIVFDPRSAFPEENIYNYNNRFPQAEFAYWKRREELLLKGCDSTICITDLYTQHFQKSTAYLKHAVIPNNVDMKLFGYKQSARERIRKKEDLDGKMVFGYLGTMYPHTWHKPGVYARFIKMLRSTGIEYIIVFMVPETNGDFVRYEMECNGILAHEYRLIHPEYDEVPAYLAACDFGLFFLSERKIALSIKVVEYLAAGLPVLVNSNCAGACSMLIDEGLGAEVMLGTGDLDSEQVAINVEKFEVLAERQSRQSISKVAREKYANEVVAESYVRVYNELHLSGVFPVKLLNSIPNSNN